MNDFQVNRRRRAVKWYFSYWVLATLILFAFGLLRGSYNNYYKSQLTAKDLDQVKGEVLDLEGRKSFLSDKLSRLRTAVGLDEELRKNFPVAKPGEKVIVIVDDETKAATTSTTTENGFSVKKMLGF